MHSCAAIVDALYRQIITAGTHPASRIRVAEAAKVIENTQRDLNILGKAKCILFDVKSVLPADQVDGRL